MLLVPILLQVLAKNLVFEPILGSYSDKNPSKVELNQEIQEQFFREFTELKEQLEIAELLGIVPPLSETERRERLEEDAVELWREARENELNGLKFDLYILSFVFAYILKLISHSDYSSDKAGIGRIRFNFFA